jgi:hypothetical protein
MLALSVTAMFLAVPDLAAGTKANAAEAPNLSSRAGLLKYPRPLLAAHKWRQTKYRRNVVSSAQAALRAQESGYRLVPLMLGIGF